MTRVVLTVFLFVCFLGLLEAGPWEGFTALAMAPDGRSFATGGREGEVLLWESATGEVLGKWTVVPGLPVVALAFSAGGASFAAESIDGTALEIRPGTVEGYPIPSSDPLQTVLGEASRRWFQSYPLTKGVGLLAGTTAVRGSPDGYLTVFGLSAEERTWKAHEAAVTGMALAPDGSFLISCGYDGTLVRWDPRTGESLGSL